MTIFLQVFYVFFSSIIETFAIPNEFLLFGSPFLGLFALVPLYLALTQAKTFRQAGLFVSLQLTLTHLLSSFWLGFFKDFAALTLGGTVGYYTVFGFFFGQLCYVPIWYTQQNKLKEKASFAHNIAIAPWNIPARIIIFASMWTMYEWYKSLGFLAYPWVTILMSSWKWPLLTQIVSITGTWGITFLFALFSALIAEGLICGFYITQKSFSSDKKTLTCNIDKIPSYTWTFLLCAALFTISVIQGFYEYTKHREPIKEVNTIIVQTNTDSWLTLKDEEAILVGQELTEKAILEYNKKPDIVVWSEAILSYYFPNSVGYYGRYPEQKPLTKFIDEIDAPFIIGGPTEINQEKSLETGIREFNNAAQYFDKNGNWVNFYGKIHLVPFAEIIPYADSEFVQKFMKAVVGFSSGWTQGEYYTTFEVPIENNESVTISTPICFEDAFPHICRALFFEGSEAFYNITNDSWSRTKSAEIQHFVIASFRAQEFRTTLVRSTNSGYSVITDPAGKIIFSLPLFEAVSGGFDVPIYEREITLYALLGNWLPKTLLTALIILYAVLFIKTKKDCNNKKIEYAQSDALHLEIEQ